MMNLKHLIHLIKCCDTKSVLYIVCETEYIDDAVVIEPVSIYIPQKVKLTYVA